MEGSPRGFITRGKGIRLPASPLLSARSWRGSTRTAAPPSAGETWASSPGAGGRVPGARRPES